MKYKISYFDFILCDFVEIVFLQYIIDLFIGISDLSDIYKKECYAGMYNKDSKKYGFYPATRCLKIKGQFVKSPYETLTIRTCVVDGGSAWGTDEEFARRDPS